MSRPVHPERDDPRVWTRRGARRAGRPIPCVVLFFHSGLSFGGQGVIFICESFRLSGATLERSLLNGRFGQDKTPYSQNTSHQRRSPLERDGLIAKAMCFIIQTAYFSASCSGLSVGKSLCGGTKRKVTAQSRPTFLAISNLIFFRCFPRRRHTPRQPTERSPNGFSDESPSGQDSA